MHTLINIDPQSGFCFGVVKAIQKAEEELQKGEKLYCLGDIVHNEREVERLAQLGLITINHEQFAALHNARVLLRAHGEPPETYRIAVANHIEIIDASCPVVRNLQQRIRKHAEANPMAQIVIFGKKGHAEVIGLQGQAPTQALVLEDESDIQKLDFSRPIFLVSQTTQSADAFMRLVELIASRAQAGFLWKDTICQQVRNREKHIRAFAQQHDSVLFVGGRNSSNGKVLYAHCREANADTCFVADASEITPAYLEACKGKRVGICGATSTPLWLMEECAAKIRNN